jgi:hypothetical protein
MSKLRCTCGHIIRDQTDCIPYKALRYADEDTPVYFEAIETIADLVQAYEHEATERPPHPQPEQQKHDKRKGLTRQITRILGHYHIGHFRVLFECENCGRLWLQVNPRENTVVSYLPESDTRGVLRSHGGTEDIPKLTVGKSTSGEVTLQRAHQTSPRILDVSEE